MINLYKASLTERIKRTADVESFRFLPGEKFNFSPGQFTQLIFDTEDLSNKELNKYLSFSSAPAKNYFELTKRLSDSKFSQKLNSLKPGDPVLFSGPLGNCTFKEEYKKIGFLIGGIGITPIISIIEYISEKKLDTDVKLFYSNRTENDIAFKKELDSWAKANKSIEINYLVTDRQSKESGKCIFGKIDKDLLLDKVKDKQERIFYLIGPPKMVTAMKEVCLEIGCSQDKLKIENFIGY
ncbi:MAG: FAD-dependent oxidoreductase [Candidatus Omnitrophica bacterium]|nr:FAD-dependent oxidoreductase [Candidatus Omnitrophota bacterium]